jgi:hypothetical protein
MRQKNTETIAACSFMNQLSNSNSAEPAINGDRLASLLVEKRSVKLDELLIP